MQATRTGLPRTVRTSGAGGLAQGGCGPGWLVITPGRLYRSYRTYYYTCARVRSLSPQVMAVVTLLPLAYGTLAALRWMSGEE